MPEEPQPNDAGGVPDGSRRLHIDRARLGVPAGVVVGNGEGSPVMDQDGVQDLADREQCPVQRPLADGHGGPEPVGGIAHENNDALSMQLSKLAGRGPRHIACRPDSSSEHRSFPRRTTTELERRHEAGGISTPNPPARQRAQGVGSLVRKEAPQLVDQPAGWVGYGATWATGPPRDRIHEFELRHEPGPRQPAPVLLYIGLRRRVQPCSITTSLHGAIPSRGRRAGQRS